MTQEALKLALEGVEIHSPNSPEYIVCAALIEALAQTQEPVAWFSPSGNLYKTRFHATANGEQVVTPLYTTPPQRTWVGLTDKERETATGWSVEHIESYLKQKNGYAEEKNT